jgi:hypothetical protein
LKLIFGNLEKDIEGQPSRAEALARASGLSGSQKVASLPPNIFLNSHDGSSRKESAAYALIGTLMQLGVLVFSGYIAYKPWNPILAGTHPRIGFPLQTFGTLFLTASLWLCTWLIDGSTVEHEWSIAKVSAFQTI